MSTPNGPKIPANVLDAAKLLISGSDSKIKAAELAGKVQTKQLKDWLQKAEVPSHEIAAFLPVYRAYRQGVSVGFSAEELRHVKPAILRDIGSAIAANKPVGKETFELALAGHERMDVMSSFDPKKVKEIAKKNETATAAREEAKAIKALSPADAALFMLKQAILQAEAHGIDVAAVMTEMHAKPTKLSSKTESQKAA